MDLVAIGRISKPIGIRGEVRISPLTPDKRRFVDLKSVWIGRSAAGAEVRKILTVRIDTKYVTVSFNGIETAGEAEKLRDVYLFVPEEDAVRLEDGSYFVNDILGCDVVTEEQMNVGIITDLLSLPMNDVWVVKSGAKEILIPAVKTLIKKVDIEHKRITVHAIDGLLD